MSRVWVCDLSTSDRSKANAMVVDEAPQTVGTIYRAIDPECDLLEPSI